MKPRVLFVDDEVDVLDGLRRALHSQEAFWQIRYVAGARQALEVLESDGADGIVTDVKMPGMSGLELLAQLQTRESTKDIPVVIMTGLQDHDLKRRALDLGAADLLAKPVDREELLARLRSVLRLKAFHDDVKRQNAQLHLTVAQRTAELAGARIDMIWRLGKLAEFRDTDTGNHVIRVSYLCRTIAEQLGMAADFVERLFLASPLHDIGKVAISDSILRKPGRLTRDEWTVMQRHCAIGAEILRTDIQGNSELQSWAVSCETVAGARADNPLLQTAASIALTHHEWWNGSGYPLALAGDQIPIESRIVAIADSYDALRSARPYKQAYSHEHAIDLMTQESDRHFDPDVYTAFMKSDHTIRNICVRLADTCGGTGA